MSNLKLFGTTDNTTSYTSDVQKIELRGNRTGVFQCNINAGDTLVLQGTTSLDLDWVTILTVTDENALQEVILAPYFQVVVTNTSGLAVDAVLHG